MPPTQTAQQREQRVTAELAALLASAAAGGALAGAAASSGVTASASALLTSLGISGKAATAIMALISTRPIGLRIGTGPLSRELVRSRASWRAAYVVQAGKRLSRAAGRGNETFQRAIRDERRFFNQHLRAQRQREQSAGQIDAANALYGRVLGWYARHDGRTTWECEVAHGNNFRADRGTVIGYPGVTGAHHGCRCRSGPPFATRRTVNQALMIAQRNNRRNTGGLLAQ